MPREPFNELWATSPDADQFEQPPTAVFNSGWEGGETADPPEAKWENWWHNRVDVALQDIERRGYMTYDEESIYGIGAYAAGSDGNIYRSQVAGNTGNNPVTDAGSNWVREPVGIATVEEARAFATNNKLLTPGRLNESFKGSNQQLSQNGFQKLPGGRIEQWGGAGIVPAGQSVVVTFQEEFPNACYRVIAVPSIGTDGTTPVSAATDEITTTSVRLRNRSSVAISIGWYAVGS